MSDPAPSPDAPPLLEALGISKAYPGVQALSDVSLTLAAGEVLCVVGENGAGKSTLMKVLAGVTRPDAGIVRLAGQPLPLGDVCACQRAGVVLIHQELNLAESLDVAGNLFLGQERVWGGWLRLLDRRGRADATAMLQRVGLNCPATTQVAELSAGQQQLVEIARALCLRSRVLIMDEPTSSLTERETARLFEVIARLKADGVGILYISHRLNEVRAIADRVVVLRDGRHVGELAGGQITRQALVERMVGRQLQQVLDRPHADHRQSEVPPALEVGELKFSPTHAPIRFALYPGEIVGVAGLIGSGRSRMVESLFGLRRAQKQVCVAGQAVRIDTPRQALEAGIRLVPEDRRLQGLWLAHSVRDNISLGSLAQLQTAGLVQRRAERALATRMCQQLNIRTASIGTAVGLLSGGNQQKVVLARWLAQPPRVLMLDEPTRGVDVGAKAEIYTLLHQLAAEGLAVLLVSSDLEEILAVCDRVLVMHQGRLAGSLSRAEMTEQAIMHLATGGDLEP